MTKKSNLETNPMPHLEKKLILLDNENVIEYGYNKITKVPLPFKLFDKSYGFTYKQGLYFVNLEHQFVQKRVKLKEKYIYLVKAKPPMKTEDGYV